jgi:hypothetical protein
LFFCFLWRSHQSLTAAGDLIQIAARLASGAIPDETRRLLLFIGARLKKRELRLGVIITLRQFIGLTKSLPVADDCEPLPALAAPEECDVSSPDCKSNILLMLNHAVKSSCLSYPPTSSLLFLDCILPVLPAQILSVLQCGLLWGRATQRVAFRRMLRQINACLLFAQPQKCLEK